MSQETNISQGPEVRTLYPHFIEGAIFTAEATQDQGVLKAIADVKIAVDPLLAATYGTEWHSPKFTYDIILEKPAAGEPLSERFVLVEKLTAATRGTVEEHAPAILKLADRLGMRRRGETEDYSTIDSSRAVFIAEGGANKTSVVRRGVAEQAIKALYGDAAGQVTLYQLGGDRKVPAARADGSDNPEHKTVRALAGEFLPIGTFTEFDANLATALADGYEIAFISDCNTQHDVPEQFQKVFALAPQIKRVVALTHKDGSRPSLVQVQPSGKGLEGGFDAINAIAPLEDKQLVIATNGQYRPKDTLQAHAWGRTRNVQMTTAVTLGDEPGDEYFYQGAPIATAARPAAAYVNEIALYGRQTAENVVAEMPAFVPRKPGFVERTDPDGAYVIEPDGSEWAFWANGKTYSGPNDAEGVHPGYENDGVNI